MGTSGPCSSGSSVLTPSVCTSLPRTGARGGSGDQALPIVAPTKWAKRGLTSHPAPNGPLRGGHQGRRTRLRTVPQGDDKPGRGRLVPSTKVSSGLRSTLKSAGRRPRPAVNQRLEGARQLCTVRWGWGHSVQRAGGCKNFFCKVGVGGGVGTGCRILASLTPTAPSPLPINCFHRPEP